MTDRIKEPWGARTPFGQGEDWPVRVDQFLEEGVSEDEVDRWVQTASILQSNGDALDIERSRTDASARSCLDWCGTARYISSGPYRRRGPGRLPGPCSPGPRPCRARRRCVPQGRGGLRGGRRRLPHLQHPGEAVRDTRGEAPSLSGPLRREEERRAREALPRALRRDPGRQSRALARPVRDGELLRHQLDHDRPGRPPYVPRSVMMSGERRYGLHARLADRLGAEFAMMVVSKGAGSRSATFWGRGKNEAMSDNGAHGPRVSL